MCGIVGYIGKNDSVPILLDSLKRLEYRGYDSAGIAVLEAGGTLGLRRCAGKISGLEKVVRENPLHGSVGVAHTRWATHGRPTEENAHPHRDCTGKLVVVQNGIIENYAVLKHMLIDGGHKFVTETDTEVIAHLIEDKLKTAKSLREAVHQARLEMEGAYSIVVASVERPGELVAAHNGPPVLLGYADGEAYVASDIAALLPYTKTVAYLEEGDVAELTVDSTRIVDLEFKPIERAKTEVNWNPIMVEKGGYRHFMLKEIFEQPDSTRETLLNRVNLETGWISFGETNLSDEDIQNLEQVHLVACGTSWHSSLVGKRYIEALAGIPCEVDYGSEYRYRDPLVKKNTLAVFVSQSGETADTLAAMEEAKGKGAKILCISNVRESTMVRKADGFLATHCGPEIGVASTKAFTGQLTALFLLAMHLGQRKGFLKEEQSRVYAEALAKLPHAMEQYLSGCSDDIKAAAKDYMHCRDFLYLGRGLHYPLALEGALKLKEISYIHAEGYPGGEMKHGPIALIDEDMPVLAVLSDDAVLPKMLGNIEEVKARNGKVLAVAPEGLVFDESKIDTLFRVPAVHPFLMPIVTALPLQLFAYHVAVLLGCDVDQPRNLAKSVTVE